MIEQQEIIEKVSDKPLFYFSRITVDIIAISFSIMKGDLSDKGWLIGFAFLGCVNLHTHETTMILAWHRRILNDSVEGVTQATPPALLLAFGNETEQ